MSKNIQNCQKRYVLKLSWVEHGVALSIEYAYYLSLYGFKFQLLTKFPLVYPLQSSICAPSVVRLATN